MSKQSPEQLNSSEAPAETYSLASILAEYKSEAFIRNERRLSRDELEKRADEIISEMKRSVERELAKAQPPEAQREETPAPSAEPEQVSAPPEEPTEGEAAAPSEEPAEESPVPSPEPEQASAPPEEPAEERPAPVAEASAEERRETEEVPAPPEEPPEETEAPAEADEAGEERPDKKAAKREKRRERSRRRVQRRAQRAEKAEQVAKQAKAAREARPELSPEEALKHYASGTDSLRRRMIPAFVLSGLMAALVFLSGRGVMPGLFGNEATVGIILIVSQLAVMLLGLDVLGRGVTDLFSAKPGFETLLLLANAAAFVDAALYINGHSGGLGLPYCVTAAASLAFGIWGTYCRRRAIRETVKAMKLASVPTVVTAEDKLAEEGIVLSKRLGSAKGFLRKCVQPDLTERFYRKCTPACLILVIILSLAAAYLSETGSFIHCLAAISSAAAALPATLAFGRPFAESAKKLSRSGAALAGWAGAEEAAKAVGLIVRDLDVYPENTIILNGMKVLSGALVEKVVAYTGSVILATGSGLRRVFGELMRQYAAPLYRVEDFDCGTEGGVSAFIGQEQILVGTRAYMNLMGIRVPPNVDLPNAVYTAIDHELCGAFIVHYQPQEPVQNALIRLETSRLRPIFAVRDFNIGPAMLVSKFRLTEGSISFLPPADRYRLSLEPEVERVPTALLSREGLWHYSEAARHGRRVWRASRRALVMTALGAALGAAITFIACARGAFAAVAPGKLLLSMLLWAFATFMIADSADGD